MGCQGEIYNILGVELPARLIRKDKPYEVNGKKIAPDEDFDGEYDLMNVIPTKAVDLKNPELIVRILGHNAEYGSGNFKGKALAGYVIANESYEDSAVRLPSMSIIESLKPRLIKDLREQFNYESKESDLEIFLMFDFSQ